MFRYSRFFYIFFKSSITFSIHTLHRYVSLLLLRIAHQIAFSSSAAMLTTNAILIFDDRHILWSSDSKMMGHCMDKVWNKKATVLTGSFQVLWQLQVGSNLVITANNNFFPSLSQPSARGGLSKLSHICQGSISRWCSERGSHTPIHRDIRIFSIAFARGFRI